jgi:hypothetical protein
MICMGSCPAEAGGSSPTLRHARGQGKLQLSARQPGQSKILVLFQGCSELFGGIGFADGPGVK